MITYKTNHAETSKSMTEWYFGKGTVRNLTASAKRMSAKSKQSEFRFFVKGTGYLTIIIH